MKKIIYVFIFFLLLTSQAFACDAPSLTTPKNCQNLPCVRKNIDTIDAEIVDLIGTRLQYVKRAGELKKSKMSVHDQAREDEILLKVSQMAMKEGYPPSIATEIYKTLLKQTNQYEMTITK